MNRKKRKDEEEILAERSEIWKHMFINDYFQFAQRTNEKWQIYGKYRPKFQRVLKLLPFKPMLMIPTKYIKRT